MRNRPRRDRPRAATIQLKTIRSDANDLARDEVDYWIDTDRPATREDCRDAPRPCVRVSCRHNLYLDVNPHTGSIKLNFPEIEPWELENTCTLDIAERGGITLEEVGKFTNLTRERVRQVEVKALHSLKLAGIDMKIFSPDGKEPA